MQWLFHILLLISRTKCQTKKKSEEEETKRRQFAHAGTQLLEIKTQPKLHWLSSSLSIRAAIQRQRKKRHTSKKNRKNERCRLVSSSFCPFFAFVLIRCAFLPMDFAIVFGTFLWKIAEKNTSYTHACTHANRWRFLPCTIFTQSGENRSVKYSDVHTVLFGKDAEWKSLYRCNSIKIDTELNGTRKWKHIFASRTTHTQANNNKKTTNEIRSQAR